MLAAALFALAIAAQGCLFEPRDPEPPSGELDPWIVPNTPKDVFANLATGFASSRNSNYERSLDATFQFKPRLEDEASLGSEVFANWTKEVELQWLSRVKGEYQGTRTVQFGDENGQFPIEDIQVRLATFEGPYRIIVNPGDGSDPETYAGLARFVVTQGTTGWVLTLWEDFDVDGNFATSGYLRGTLRAAQ